MNRQQLIQQFESQTVPWHNKIIIGTTDTPVDHISPEPVAMEEEIDFILEHAARYLTKDPSRADVRSVFAGLRPLVKSTAKKTAELSRDHSILISAAGLISIVGGKWTTYRKMAEDVVNTAAIHAQLPYRDCVTKELAVHGATPTTDFTTDDYYYGSDKPAIDQLIAADPSLAALLHPALPYTRAMIVWGVQQEMCMTVEDALSRRTRALLLDAKAAMEAAPGVAQLMATEMQQDEQWVQSQLNDFYAVAKKYLPEM